MGLYNSFIAIPGKATKDIAKCIAKFSEVMTSIKIIFVEKL